MKRLATILVFLTCLNIFQASAQWYIFPGKNKQKERKEKPAVIEQIPDTSVTVNVLDIPVSKDTVISQSQEMVDDFVLDIPQTVNITLLLPLRSTTKPSGNFYEFYTGALLAASDLGKKGCNIALNIFDTSDKGTLIPDNVLADSDIIIGPVRTDEIRSLLPRCAENQYVISPLEPSALNLVDSCNVIQLPVSWESQTDELVKWMVDEKFMSDAVFILTDNNPAPEGGQEEFLLTKLEENNIDYTIIRSNDVSSLQLANRNAFLISSDDEKFICTAVNNIGNLAEKSDYITLYGLSKFRSMDGIHSESLYKANARLTANYYVDYNDAAVKDFIRRFRAVYNSEPSSFAFHGYDTVSYFTNLVNTYGRQWKKKISQYHSSGLQTDFKFNNDGKQGAENTAVRRIRYHKDLSTSLQ